MLNIKNRLTTISSVLLAMFLPFSVSFGVYSADYDFAKQFNILSMQERSKLQDNRLKNRIETLLPSLMRQANIDMWILISREYNEDPLLKTLLPSTWLSARRRTILVFTDLGRQGVKAQAIARYDVGDIYAKAWDKDTQPEQMQALTALIEQYQPTRIGINQSDVYGHADGLTATEKSLLQAHIPKQYQQKLVSAEPLAIAWLETRTQADLEQYRQLVSLTKAIIKQGFSNDVIRPRKTKIGDLVWWFRQRVSELGLQTWFQPSVKIQRKYKKMGVSDDQNLIIMPGDLLHVDFGLSYLGLNSDIQQHAYVLLPEQSHPPSFLVDALSKGNELQDILIKQFKEGRSGNEILSRTRERALLAGLRPMIYSHPIGFHGHGAGTTIGMWDAQHGVPGSGDRRLQNNTAYAIELNVKVASEEWQKDISIMLEENAIYWRGKVQYLAPRQEQLMVIKHK